MFVDHSSNRSCIMKFDTHAGFTKTASYHVGVIVCISEADDTHVAN